jgi:nicotinamide phosphoribosyltransferase
LNRDTLRFALKCSAIDINGQWHDVYKQPITDPGKDSRAGRFVLLREGNEFITVKREEGRPQEGIDQLELVLEDGVLHRDQSLDEIRDIVTSFDAYEKIRSTNRN